MVAAEPEEHAVTAACAEVEGCTAFNSSMAAKISGVEDMFWPADIKSTTDEAAGLEMLEAIELTSKDAGKKAVAMLLHVERGMMSQRLTRTNTKQKDEPKAQLKDPQRSATLS